MTFTFFFRDIQILSLALRNFVLSASGRCKIHICHTGCATDMKTYTFATLFAERVGKFALRNYKIHAINIDYKNADYGKTVTKGVFHNSHLQRIQTNFSLKYFSKTENEDYSIINRELMALTHYQNCNLLVLQPLRSDYSLIICKNVLLHFCYQLCIEVLNMY
jgi:chemotaxis protein methyltransferase CheR